jgi:hypothetical protein
LRDVGESLEFFVLIPPIDAVALRQHPFVVIRLFDLNKYQGHTVNQHRYIGPKFFLPVFAGQFSSDVKAIVSEILEINQFNPRCSSQAFVEFTAQLVVIELKAYFFQVPIYLSTRSGRVNSCDAILEDCWENIGFFLPEPV